MAVAWPEESQILIVMETRRICANFKALTQDLRHKGSSSFFGIGLLCCLQYVSQDRIDLKPGSLFETPFWVPCSVYKHFQMATDPIR